MVSKKLPHKSESGEKIAKMKLVIQEQEKLKWGKVFQVNIISLQNEHSYWHMTEQSFKFMCENHSNSSTNAEWKITVIKFLNFFLLESRATLNLIAFAVFYGECVHIFSLQVSKA